jgi:elongation factor Ts
VNLDVQGVPEDKAFEVGKDMAMQIAALNPLFLDKSQVNQQTLDKEKEILLIQAQQDPKTPESHRTLLKKWSMAAWASIIRKTASCSRTL